MNEIFTVPETANKMRVKDGTMRKWIRERRIATVKLGGRVFIRQADIADFIEKNYHPAKE